jgi:hypothetical protein
MDFFKIASLRQNFFWIGFQGEYFRDEYLWIDVLMIGFH